MKKWTLVILLLALSLSALYLLVFYTPNDPNSDGANSEDTAEIDSGSETPDNNPDATPTTDELDEQLDSSEEKQNPESAPRPENVKPIITQAEYNASDEKVVVKAFIPDSGKGTCTATYTKDNKSFSETSGTTFVGNYYQCDGFSTARSKFSESGTWSVKIAFQSNTQDRKSVV